MAARDLFNKSHSMPCAEDKLVFFKKAMCILVGFEMSKDRSSCAVTLLFEAMIDRPNTPIYVEIRNSESLTATVIWQNEEEMRLFRHRADWLSEAISANGGRILILNAVQR